MGGLWSSVFQGISPNFMSQRWDEKERALSNSCKLRQCALFLPCLTPISIYFTWPSGIPQKHETVFMFIQKLSDNTSRIRKSAESSPANRIFPPIAYRLAFREHYQVEISLSKAICVNCCICTEFPATSRVHPNI